MEPEGKEEEKSRQPECKCGCGGKGRGEEEGGRILVRRVGILFSELPAAEILVDPERMGVGVGDA